MNPTAPRTHWQILTAMVQDAVAAGYALFNRGQNAIATPSGLRYYRIDVYHGEQLLAPAYGQTYSGAVANALEVVRSHQRRAA